MHPVLSNDLAAITSMNTIQAIPVWLFSPLPAYLGRLALHGDLSMHSAARWQGRPGGSWSCGGVVEALWRQCYAWCLPWSPAAALAAGALCVFISTARHRAGSSPLGLLPRDNQVFESGRIPPQATRSFSNRPHGSGKDSAWRRGRPDLPEQTHLRAWGVPSAILLMASGL